MTVKDVKTQLPLEGIVVIRDAPRLDGRLIGYKHQGDLVVAHHEELTSSLAEHWEYLQNPSKSSMLLRFLERIEDSWDILG